MTSSLSLPETLLFACCKDGKGLSWLTPSQLLYTIGAGLLLEMLLQEHLCLDFKTCLLSPTDKVPQNDDLLKRIFQKGTTPSLELSIKKMKKNAACETFKEWLDMIVAIPNLKNQLLQQLSQKGMIEEKTVKLFRIPLYKIIIIKDIHTHSALHDQLRQAIASQEHITDARLLLMLCILHATKTGTSLFDGDYGFTESRIKELIAFCATEKIISEELARILYHAERNEAMMDISDALLEIADSISDSFDGGGDGGDGGDSGGGD